MTTTARQFGSDTSAVFRDIRDRLVKSRRVVHHRRELLNDGDSSYVMTQCIKQGMLVRVAHGFYAESAKWADLKPERQHVEYAQALARQHPDLQFSHATAALVQGMPWKRWRIPAKLQCVVGSQTKRRSSASVQRRHFDLDDKAIRHNGVLVTSAPRTVLDVACESEFAIGLACADYVLVRRLATKRQLLDAISENSHRYGIHRARLVVDLADDRIESAGESFCRAVIHQLGFVLPTLQHVFWDGRTMIGRGDFYWPESRVLVEFDGKVKYLDETMLAGRSTSEVVVEEKRREDRIRAQGIKVIRLTWVDLSSPDDIEQTLAGAGVPKRR